MEMCQAPTLIVTGEGPASVEVADFERPLCVSEELDLLCRLLKDCCTHLVLPCMACSLREWPRFISAPCFPVWYWISLSDPCVFLREGSQALARDGLFLLCGYYKPINGQHSLMFDSCCCIAHKLMLQSAKSQVIR